MAQPDVGIQRGIPATLHRGFLQKVARV